MNNKSIIIAIVILLVAFIFYTSTQKSVSIEDATKIDLNEITKIELYYGRPGQDGVSIVKKDEITQFVKLLRKYRLKELKQQPVIAGYYQACNLYHNDRKVISLIFGDPLQVNSIYYKVIKGELKSDQIDEIIKLNQ